VNVVGALRSVYRWKGEVQQDDEVLLLVKTAAGRYRALERRLRELHPYECPEVLAFEAAAGAEPYLRWVAESVEPGPVPDEG